jgi:hypothetical protein
MAVRTALQVHIPSRTGTVMTVLQTLAREGVQVAVFAGVTGTDESIVEVLCADPALATAAFRAADLLVEEFDVAVAWLPDVPACLAEACETLVAAGIHVRSVCVIAVESERGQLVMIESTEVRRADQLLWALRY